MGFANKGIIIPNQFFPNKNWYDYPFILLIYSILILSLILKNCRANAVPPTKRNEANKGSTINSFKSSKVWGSIVLYDSIDILLYWYEKYC